MSKPKTRQEWTPEEVTLLKDKWANSTSEQLFSFFPGRTWRSLKYKAIELGIRGRQKGGHKTSAVNELFFESWNRDMAYVFGFWFADGCMSQPNKQAQIYFTSADREHLELIKHLMQSKHNIRTRKNDNSYDLIIGSQLLWKGLLKLGGLPAKSLIAEMPFVPEKYLQDWMRGLLDGDGYLTWNGRYPSLAVCGTFSLLTSIQEILSIQVGVNKQKVYYYNKSSPFLKYGAKDSILIASWLYQDESAPALERKRLIANKFMNWENK